MGYSEIRNLPSGRVERAVVALLREQPRKLWTPAEIARETGEQPGSVRKALCRLTDEQNPHVVRVAHGLYRCFRDPGAIAQMEAPNPKLHGIQLTSRLPQNRGWGPPGPAKVAWGSIERSDPWREDPANGQIMRDFAWRGRVVKVHVSPRTGAVQVSLKAGDEPLAPDEFLAFLDWLDGALTGSGIVWAEPHVVPNSLEMNLDYRELWLDGAKRLKVRSFVNGWVQVYQRDPGTLRAEVRMQPEDGELGLDELREWVQGMLGMLHNPSGPGSGARPDGRPDPLGPEVA